MVVIIRVYQIDRSNNFLRTFVNTNQNYVKKKLYKPLVPLVLPVPPLHLHVINGNVEDMEQQA